MKEGGGRDAGGRNVGGKDAGGRNVGGKDAGGRGTGLASCSFSKM